MKLKQNQRMIEFQKLYDKIGEYSVDSSDFAKFDKLGIMFDDLKKYVDKEFGITQQEIDKLKTFRDNAVKKWCDSQAELERERGLQKQKLQQLIHQWDNKGHLGITIQETDWLLGEFGSLRKLAEELLK